MSDITTKVSISPEVSGADSAASEIGKIYEELRKGTKTVEEANNEMRSYSDTIYAQRRAIMLMRTEWRNQNAALLEAMRGMMSVARLGRNMTNIFQTHTLMQTRVADSTRDIRDTEEELERVRARRIMSQAELGAGNMYALGMMEEERRLAKRLVEERRDLKQAQDQNALGYVSIALAAVDVIPNLVDIWGHTRNIKAIMGANWAMTGLAGLKTALSVSVTEAGILSTTVSTLAAVGSIAIPIAVTIAGLAALNKLISNLDKLPGELDILTGKEPSPTEGTRQGRENIDLTEVIDDVWSTLTDPETPGNVAGTIQGPGGGLGNIIQDIFTADTGDEVFLGVPSSGAPGPSNAMDIEQYHRSGGGQGVTINQVNNISADDEDTVNRILDSVVNMFYETPVWAEEG